MLNPDNTIYPFLQLAVNEKQAQKLFHNWTQWRLLESVGGRSLNPILKGLALSINTNWDKDDSSINLRASVQMG